MKVVLTLLGLINGLYMLLDGLYVMLKGKYIGPERPGPWAQIFYKLQIDVFKLGPVFILYGLLWLIWTYALISSQSWGYTFGLTLAALTLWYLPFGTLISVITITVLIIAKAKLGF
jgi:hypothetical protein